MSESGVAVIVDLVRSRDQSDKLASRENLTAALNQVNTAIPAVQPLEPTIGDECQALYSDLPAALKATLLLRLYLPTPLDSRFGIGVGNYEPLGVGNYGLIQDGPAWWSAREAIDEAKRLETGRHDTLRTWYASTEDTAPGEALTNAYLLCRDQLVSAMSDRNRRLLLGLIEGKAQVELAAAEGITEGAVSQSLRRAGVHAVLTGMDLLEVSQ